MVQVHRHISVLKQEVLAALNISPEGIYLDGTLGRCGHAQGILSAMGDRGRLLGLDADPEAIDFARNIFAADARTSVFHCNFSEMRNVCDQAGLVGLVDGVLLDLGVSSPQIDEARRGFSFMHDGPLDMRLDCSVGVSARDWIALTPEVDMAAAFWQYGEERYSRRIARAIVQRRVHKPFETTLDLAQTIKTAHPRWEKHKHPATRVFQAVRIAVNQELLCLRQALDSVRDLLRISGRLVVISFHSLEDRLVKRFIRGDQHRVQRLRGVPIGSLQDRCGLKPVGKAIRPSSEEVKQNPRARSAVLRIAERVA